MKKIVDKTPPCLTPFLKLRFKYTPCNACFLSYVTMKYQGKKYQGKKYQGKKYEGKKYKRNLCRTKFTPMHPVKTIIFLKSNIQCT